MTGRSRAAISIGAACLLLQVPTAGAAPREAPPLQAQYEVLAHELAHSAFGRPLHLGSTESPGRAEGTAFALLHHPHAHVAAALQSPAHWCEMLLLPFNTKLCRHGEDAEGAWLVVYIGRKNDEPLARANTLKFRFSRESRGPDDLSLRLSAPEGPAGSRDLRLEVDTAALDASRCLLRLRYSLAFGLAGRAAMQAYLATAGRGKAGFSTVDPGPGREPVLVSGVRGMIERTTMRHFLAVEALLDHMGRPPQERFEQAARAWFTATERHPRQLREMEGSAYLAMKRREYARQVEAQAAGGAS